jgi:Fur family transcriptional regulator, ferric uptake regulator
MARRHKGKQLLEEAEWLRGQGHRLTPQRLLVLQAVKSHQQHITAEEIHAEVVREQPYIDIATVYRSLQWLQSVGLVSPITIGDGRQRFEYRHPNHTHHHLICQHCGDQVEIPDELLATLRDDIHRRYGFTVQSEHMAFHGTCSACEGSH